MQTQVMNDTTYYKNAKGELIPETMVKPIDRLRDQLVLTIEENLEKTRLAMQQTKVATLAEIQSFLEIAAEEYGVSLGGKKGNMTLTSYDGETKLVIAMNDKLDYTEGMLTAKELIDEYLSDLTKDSNNEIKTLVMRAFRVKEGKMDVKRILELRSYNISDERWKKAMDIITDSIIVSSSRQYFRLYKRDENQQYQVVNLDFSTL